MEVLVGDVGLGDLVVGVVAFGGDGLDFADELGGFKRKKYLRILS